MASYFLGTDQLNQVTEHEKPNQPNQLKTADSIRERPKFCLTKSPLKKRVNFRKDLWDGYWGQGK